MPTTRKKRNRRGRGKHSPRGYLRHNWRPTETYSPSEFYLSTERIGIQRIPDSDLTSQQRRFSGAKPVGVDPVLCVGCGACIDACPQGAIDVTGGKAHVDPYKCSGCGSCTQVCPQGAIGWAR